MSSPDAGTTARLPRTNVTAVISTTRKSDDECKIFLGDTTGVETSLSTGELSSHGLL